MTLNKKWFILFLFTLQKFDTWQNGKSLAWQHATSQQLIELNNRQRQSINSQNLDTINIE